MRRFIINLTGKPVTQAMEAQGVVELPQPTRDTVSLLHRLPSDLAAHGDIDQALAPDTIRYVARSIALHAEQTAINYYNRGDEVVADRAVIDGEPFLLSALEQELDKRGIEAGYCVIERTHTTLVTEEGVSHHQAPQRVLGFVWAKDIQEAS